MHGGEQAEGGMGSAAVGYAKQRRILRNVMMQERAVFLDRDNTIIANDGYLGDPAMVKLLPGAGVTLASLRRIGYRIIVVSNQSGVARGLFGPADVEAVNEEMGRQLRRQAGAHIDANYFCPFHPEAVVPSYRGDHEWRKPRPGMLKQAAADFNLDLSQCWLIGDQPRDIAAGASVGCRTILLRDASVNAGAVPSAPSDGTQAKPDFVVKSLADAARIIVREGSHVTKPSVAAQAVKAAPEPPVADVSEAAVSPMAEVVVPASSPPPIHAVPPADASAPGTASAAPAASHMLLEDIARQVRQLHRRAQPADFSFWSLVALIVQIMVVLFLAMALWDGLAAGTYLQTTDKSWWFDRTSAQLGALEWLLAALVFQVAVLGMYLFHRHD